MAFDTTTKGIDAEAIGAEADQFINEKPADVKTENEKIADAETDNPKIGMTYGELLNLKLPPREEIIAGLAKRETGLLNAVTNTGKSTLIRNTSLCLICGKPFPPIIRSGRKMRVVIIDSEDTLIFLRSDIRNMIASSSDADKKLVEDNLLLICDVVLKNEELRINKKDHFNLLVSTIADFKADIVFVDTISKSFVISNENDNSEIKERVMIFLQRLAKLTDTAVMAAHHIGKSKLEEGSAREGSHRGRGASSFADQSRAIYNLDRDVSDNVILSCPKLKGEKFADTTLKYSKETRWFENHGERVVLSNYEVVMQLFKDEKTIYKRGEIDKKLKGKITISTITRILNEAIRNEDLVKSKGVYSKNAQMLTH